MQRFLVVLLAVASAGLLGAGCRKPLLDMGGGGGGQLTGRWLTQAAPPEGLPTTVTAKDGPDPVSVTVMDMNLYLGADLVPAMQALIADPESVPAEVGKVWADVKATDFNARAELQADAIASANPALIGLQEVAVWRLQTPADSITERPRPAKAVQYDFLKILLKALRKRGLHYRAVAVSTNLDIEMPGIVGDGLSDIRLTDRNVILARKGVPISRRRSGVFETLLVLPYGDDGMPLPQSWTSVNAKVGGRTFRFINTHLEDGYEDIQRAQLAEILAGPGATDLPVVLVGDFNSDGTKGYAPGVHADAVAAGLVDSWPEVSPAEGLTWGHAPLLDNTTTDFTYRLDYVFHSAGITATAGYLVGEDPADRVGGLWPSDHAGLVIDLLLP